jgi:pimeloyl-ACP methyl ester carboxylesterase
MVYERGGHGEPPIVFVHGFGCDRSDWRAQTDRLRSTTTVVACDLRGHGETPGRPEDCSIETYGADLVQLLDELELPRAVLVGHSMGCRVVLEANRRAPDRVAGIVLVDGSMVGADDPAAVEQDLAQRLADHRYEPFIRDFFEAMFVPDSDPEVRAAIIQRALLLPAPIGSALFPRLAGWDAGQMRAALAEVRVPLMVVQSTAMNPDRVRVTLRPGQGSPWLDCVRSQLPAARIETLPGSGHFPHVEQPDVVAALIGDFVAGLR